MKPMSDVGHICAVCHRDDRKGKPKTRKRNSVAYSKYFDKYLCRRCNLKLGEVVIRLMDLPPLMLEAEHYEVVFKHQMKMTIDNPAQVGIITDIEPHDD